MEIDSDEESFMIAANAQKCKFDIRFSQKLKQNSNSLVIPAIIENIKTYALLDTGSTCSLVTPTFFKYFGSALSFAKSIGTIQLAHTDSKFDRIGQNILYVFYNKSILNTHSISSLSFLMKMYPFVLVLIFYPGWT
ncbi:hypothetical protein BCV72DRAFT_130850 [Rhizopus microsporus var. microsporus]|uniref:Uncharacterized protein n=1 Tax=Rhizopus microsporus var. microsporus TaxID=86635 RepID=A0A1X0R1S8_RHIZD|nr:hypothetical protein BCV72DRAFT_130850 [Rhizopus microsporus var. microsporus]